MFVAVGYKLFFALLRLLVRRRLVVEGSGTGRVARVVSIKSHGRGRQLRAHVQFSCLCHMPVWLLEVFELCFVSVGTVVVGV